MLETCSWRCTSAGSTCTCEPMCVHAGCGRTQPALFDKRSSAQLSGLVVEGRAHQRCKGSKAPSASHHQRDATQHKGGDQLTPCVHHQQAETLRKTPLTRKHPARLENVLSKKNKNPLHISILEEKKHHINMHGASAGSEAKGGISPLFLFIEHALFLL